jgi:hypothetical protein
MVDPIKARDYFIDKYVDKSAYLYRDKTPEQIWSYLPQEFKIQIIMQEVYSLRNKLNKK